MKSPKESPSTLYTITDKQIIRDMGEARLPIDAESSCAAMLARMVGCRPERSGLVNALHHARLHLRANSWEYHYSHQRGAHVFQFHLPKS